MIVCHKTHLEQRCRERGYTLDEVMGCVVLKDGDMWAVDETHHSYPAVPKGGVRPRQNVHQHQQASPPPLGDGAGTELKALLKDWFGITSSATCKCNAIARKMNMRGVDWVLSGDGLKEVTEAMKGEHAKRKAAGKTRLPWSEFGAKQLIKLACRRAKAKGHDKPMPVPEQPIKLPVVAAENGQHGPQTPLTGRAYSPQ